MKLITGLGVLVLAVPLAAAAVPLPGSPLVAIVCSSCHLVTDNAGGVPADTAALLTDAQELLCADCHPRQIDSGHPSGFVPERLLPAEYPLDFTGFLTCSSCHWIHDPGHGLARIGALQDENCTGCHQY